MYTFTLTIALADDHGETYSQDAAHETLKGIARSAGVTLFSFAQGWGYDDGGKDEDAERILIVQGIGQYDDVTTFGERAAFYAGVALNQRAVGWWTSHDSYRSTEEWTA